jgi:hypothetical protein
VNAWFVAGVIHIIASTSSIHATGVKCAGICHIASMDENNLEIIVALGSWQTTGKAARWCWQVRQRVPPKFLVKDVTLGAKQRAQDSAQAPKAKILARVPM